MLARQLSHRFDQGVERTGVSRAKFGALATIARFPGATQRLVAEALQVSEVTAGRLIERLCSDGYVERRESPDDRRARNVYLTDAAEPLIRQLRGMAQAQEEEAFAGFDDAELALLASLLERITGNLAGARARPAAASPDCGTRPAPDRSRSAASV